MTGLELRDVSLRAGDFRVGPLDLSVRAGEYFILMGHTGAGKSLLMKAICGVHPLEAGRVLIGPHDVTNMEPHERGLGYVPQDSGLFPHLDVRGNIGFALDLLGLAAGESAERVDAVAEELGIAPLLARRVGGLSGGERQKVSLARALTRRPGLLLLDEPVSSLDERSRDDIAALLKRVHREHGLTTVHICHNRVEAETLGDRIGRLSAGRLMDVQARNPRP